MTAIPHGRNGLLMRRRTPRQSKARRHEFLIRACNRPFAFLFLEIVRQLGDVVHVPGLGYFVHHPEVAKAVLEHPNVSNSEIGSYGAWFTQVLGAFALINMEGTEHRQLKSFLRKFFDEGSLQEAAGEELAHCVERLRRSLEAGASVDLSGVMQELSSRVFCRVLGVELTGAAAEQQYREIFRLSANLTSYGTLVKKLLRESEVSAARLLHEKLAEFTRSAYQRHDTHPRSIVAGLKAAGFCYAEVEGLLTSLLVAGTAIVTIAVPRMAAVLIDSGAFDELREDVALLDRAIDELLRFVTPSNVLFRVTTSEIRLNGHACPKGARIYVVFYALAKHQKFFPQPQTLELRRAIPAEVKQLWFGHGRHSCLGIVLARMIIFAVLRMLVALNGKLLVTKRRYGRNAAFPGYKHLWIALEKNGTGA